MCTAPDIVLETNGSMTRKIKVLNNKTSVGVGCADYRTFLLVHEGGIVDDGVEAGVLLAQGSGHVPFVHIL